MRPVDQPRRHPIAVDIRALVCAGVLDRVGVLGFGDHRHRLLGEPGLAPVGVDRSIRGDLRAVDRDRPEARQPSPASDHQDLAE